VSPVDVPEILLVILVVADVNLGPPLLVIELVGLVVYFFSIAVVADVRGRGVVRGCRVELANVVFQLLLGVAKTRSNLR